MTSHFLFHCSTPKGIYLQLIAVIYNLKSKRESKIPKNKFGGSYMIKTVTLKGEEVKVQNLGGFNTVVHNLGLQAIYASKYPNITAGADNVAEIPANGAKLISTTNGTVYLLGTGKAELTGQDHDGVNFKQPSSLGGGGTSDVTKAYVDEMLLENLDAAKEYTDTELVIVKDDIAELRSTKADRAEIPTTLPANGGNSDTVNGHTISVDVPADAKFTDTIYSVATPSSDGLESKEDKTKLDGIEAGANNYTLAKATKTELGGVKIGDNLSVTADGTLSAPSALPASGGSADTASKLTTARYINDVPFDGTANISLSTIYPKSGPIPGETNIDLNSNYFRKAGVITIYKLDQNSSTVTNGITGIVMRGWIVTCDFSYGQWGKQYYVRFDGADLYYRTYGYSSGVVHSNWIKIR